MGQWDVSARKAGANPGEEALPLKKLIPPVLLNLNLGLHKLQLNPAWSAALIRAELYWHKVPRALKYSFKFIPLNCY